MKIGTSLLVLAVCAALVMSMVAPAEAFAAAAAAATLVSCSRVNSNRKTKTIGTTNRGNSRPSPCMSMTVKGNNDDKEQCSSTSCSQSLLSRRSVLKRQASIVALARFVVTSSPLVSVLPFSYCSSNAANALVYVDPNRYGDRELQVGTIAKLRQCVRDAIFAVDTSKNNSLQLASLFVQLAIQDALTYNCQTQTGGPNGRIVDQIIQTSSQQQQRQQQQQPYDLELYRTAALELQAIRNKLQKSTEITMADVVSFAGAEAIECLGGPRIVLALGKLDDDDAGDGDNDTRNKQQQRRQEEITIYDLDNGPQTIQAFRKAGLTERDVTLLMGALASMQQVIDQQQQRQRQQQQSFNAAVAASGNDDNDNDLLDKDNEMGDEQVDFPTTFGGARLSSPTTTLVMDDSIFGKEAALQMGKKATGVWSNDIVQEWTMRYSKQKGAFFKDLPEAYRRLVQVGSTGRWEP